MSVKRWETHVLVGSFELQRLQMNQILELINSDKPSQFSNSIWVFEFLVSSCGIWLETCFKWFFCGVSNGVPNRPTDAEHCTLSADRANNTPLAPPDNGLSLEHSTGLFSEDFLFRFCCLNLDHFSGLRDYAYCLSTLCYYPCFSHLWSIISVNWTLHFLTFSPASSSLSLHALMRSTK